MKDPSFPVCTKKGLDLMGWAKGPYKSKKNGVKGGLWTEFLGGSGSPRVSTIA